MVKQLFLAIGFTVLCISVTAQKTNYVQLTPGESERKIIQKAANIVPSTRQLRWQQLELTAFFHFGMNTFTGREWGDGKEDPAIFNPTALDAVQWVQTMKDAGFKQVIVTAKHHDGFCLWPTKTTQHSVKNSPWKNGKGDVVKEVATACKKLGMGFGIYLSPWDRNSPVYGTDAYNDFFVQQLTELLTGYGKVDEVWFDGANGEGPNGKKQVYDFNRWYRLIRKLQPQAVIAIMGPDVRWVGTESGHGRSMEWSVVPTNNLDQDRIAAGSQQGVIFKPQGDMTGDDLGSRKKIVNAKGLVWYPAETDVSIRPGWFYHADQDQKVKTPEELMSIYFTSVGMNSVLLLNVPPDKRGLINEHDVKTLQEWSRIRRELFKINLLKGAAITCKNGLNMPAMLDGNNATHFTTKGTDTATVILFSLKQAKTFNVFSVQENIRVGQRVERFSVYYKNGDQWKPLIQESTIGYKRLLRFDPVTADAIRIEIESSRLNPAIAEVGLYCSPAEHR
ncbi:alpha-L-fucosidase [Niabella ginsenosidivorans]|uniref:alpha-L-fucosidase n=1 Tax=Niabella ginsenosidivorans TaxID=1176587 RepID=A0A1A9I7N5_9BACT|nr:alpha-L-fucosidase [Niabella ginsenosidivorans]ANH82711.1 alpha-L-fucosidase [Niabella ginsenosidivorans]